MRIQKTVKEDQYLQTVMIACQVLVLSTCSSNDDALFSHLVLTSLGGSNCPGFEVSCGDPALLYGIAPRAAAWLVLSVAPSV